jgi:hypothetical protein
MASKKKYEVLYSRLLERLPHCPHLPLVIHSSKKHFEKCFWFGIKKFNLTPEAFFDGEDLTIHVCLFYMKDQSKEQILFNYLHEIGHAYALIKYGYQDTKWKDIKVSERYANKFAYRWISKLRRERF